MPHAPVLLKEVIEYLNLKPGDKVIDATLDGGGHSLEILKKIGPRGKILGIEWDGELLKQFELKVKSLKFKNNFILVNDNYRNLKKIAGENNFLEANGILFDLGMSSWHLSESERGFSFQKDEPLDMRFQDRSLKFKSLKIKSGSLTAAEIVNMWPPEEIDKILQEFGEEKFSRPISKAIVEARKKKPIISTFQLIEVVKKAVPFWYQHRRINFATKTFQALRIAVNDELGNLEAGLIEMPKVLKKGSRGVVISFHSFEDRIVKNRFQELKKAGIAEIITKKPVRPATEEATENPRSRSAKLRAVEVVSREV